MPALHDLIGQRVRLAGHFAGIVRIEDAERLGDNGYTLRVRTGDGGLHETVILDSDVEAGVIESIGERAELVAGGDFFDFVEARRIELAFAHDPTFAVSLSGIRGLPHQIVAVYRHMLPQARLRFVLADDPGAGKTIMAGLLMKELHLRAVADRILILCPAPLTVQWQDELREKFDETFELIDSHKVKWQLAGNPWQQHDRVIASIDFAKRDEVLPDLLLADWDLVVIDEAHKCSAATRWDAEEQRERLDRTKRYTLAEELASRAERLLLMTATPHSGDPQRFQNFVRLLDPDQFAISDLARQQIGREDSPYFLRRQKEDLCDETGAPLFQPREVHRQPFDLSPPELRLYEAVTEYIQEFLGATGGRRGNAIALARTVLQRRLASSLGAIRSSLHKRAERITERIELVERMPPAERAKQLAEFRLLPDFDSEREEDDATEDEQDLAATGVVVAETLDTMRTEVARLRQLEIQADIAIASGEETKLTKLRECLDSTELRELKEDGRAKLLIFTEHRDTLAYLERNISSWGYQTCTIHGGIPPMQRKEIQQAFHQDKQVCIATEAAGEGINLQFCHLMINYDLPWNPVRLEQRMGRIHRIGQEKTCVIFNLYAANTIEGALIDRLLIKLDEMRADLGGRVYDVVGEVLERNNHDFQTGWSRALRHLSVDPGQPATSWEEPCIDRVRRWEIATSSQANLIGEQDVAPADGGLVKTLVARLVSEDDTAPPAESCTKQDVAIAAFFHEELAALFNRREIDHRLVVRTFGTSVAQALEASWRWIQYQRGGRSVAVKPQLVRAHETEDWAEWERMVRAVIRRRPEIRSESLNNLGRNDRVRALCLPAARGSDATADEWQHSQRLSRAVGNVLRQPGGLEALLKDLRAQANAPADAAEGQATFDGRTLLIPWRRQDVGRRGAPVHAATVLGAWLDGRKVADNATLDDGNSQPEAVRPQPRPKVIHKAGKAITRWDARVKLHEKYQEAGLLLENARNRQGPEAMETMVSDILARHTVNPTTGSG